MLLEVSGDGGEEKAERFVGRIKEIIKSRKGAKVWRPSRMQRLKLSGLPIGVTAEEIAKAVAEAGDGDPGRCGSGRYGPTCLGRRRPGRTARRT